MNMKRFPVGMLFLTLALILPMLGAGRSASAAKLEYIEATGIFNICANPEALPYTSEEAQQPGFQLELHDAIAKALGWRQSVTWAYNRPAGGRQDCGGWMSMIVAPDMLRPRGYLGTEPYMGSGLVIVAPPGANTHADSLAAFLDEPAFRNGGAVGIALGAWIGGLIEGHGVKTIGFVEQTDIIEGVRTGHVSAGVVKREDAEWYLARQPGAYSVFEIYKLDPRFRWNIAIGLRKSDQALVERVNGVLERMRADGTVQAIVEKYGIQYLPPFPIN